MIQNEITGKLWDRIIIGAGITGLWHARHAINRGENVLVVEKRLVGAGGSGGFLGALMPHMPDNWNEKKQFQFNGLSTIANAIAQLETDTGMECGFRRCGRVMPLDAEGKTALTSARVNGAEQNWTDGFSMKSLGHISDAGYRADWVNADIAQFGILHDTLSARLDPRKCVAALKKYVESNALLIEGLEVVCVDPESGSVRFGDGRKASAGIIVVASGWEAYPLLQPFMGELNGGEPIGRGVKGQAVLVNFDHEDDLPIVYHDGVYVVPHRGNRVAVGSTSLNDWQSGKHADHDAFDPDDMNFYQKAIELVPALQEARIAGRWAGVRPRNTMKGRGTAPWIGPVPGNENLIALVGGFKITFGIAHLDREFT